MSSPLTGNVDSKFRMILLTAKRARQIQDGAKPLVHTSASKATRIAQEELKAGVLPYDITATDGVDEAMEEESPEAVEG
jgi:DNA-directed RNA polymerase subunit omega